jgi:hypothetical protein
LNGLWDHPSETESPRSVSVPGDQASSRRFTAEEGLATPSLKNKRPALKARFENDLKTLYAGLKD